MKLIQPTIVLLASLALAVPSLAADSAGPTNPPAAAPGAPAQPAPAVPPAPDTTSAQAPATAAPVPPPAAAPAAPTTAAVAAITAENTTNGLRMNFHNAPLNLVLDYMVDAAGFIINKRTDVSGYVEITSPGSITKDEAVELLNSVLKQNGYAMTRKGRILTILRMDSAKTDNLPIVQGNNPEEVDESDEVVTQIIPVRYASVSQLTANLETLLPSNATLSANEGANSLILVATKTDIKRMLKIIDALDTSIASVSSIKVIPLKFADAKDTATLITQLFTPSTGGQSGGAGGGRGNLFNMFGGPGFGGFGGRGGGGGGGGAGAGGSRSSAANASRVVAVGDDRSNSLVVSAPSDLLSTIAEMVDKIDQPVTDETELRMFRLVNADPTELANQLSSLFPDDSSTTGAGQNNMPFFMRGPFGGGANNSGASANGSQRTKKLGKVIAVPDPRTSSIIVTASKTVMPQIAEMIAELDAHPDKKEVVMVYDLKNADPQDVSQVLQDLFNRTINRQNNNNNSRNSLLGTGNPLTQRETSTTSATGNSGVNSLSGSGSTRSTGF